VDGKYLVDLPGYGYAKVPAQIKKRWEAFLGEFLRLRPQLAGLIVIMDVRHPVTDLDLRLLDWFAPTGKPVHVLLTKSDKLTRQASSKTLAQVRRFLDDHYPGFTAQLFSSVSRSGVESAEQVIAGWLRLTGNKKPPVKGE
jgi:GTP-binding protein